MKTTNILFVLVRGTNELRGRSALVTANYPLIYAKKSSDSGNGGGSSGSGSGGGKYYDLKDIKIVDS